MAEILEAVLQLSIDAFTASLQQAAQQVTAFAQAISGSIGNSAQAFQQQVQQINRVAEATRQAAQVHTAAHRQTQQSINETTQTLGTQEQAITSMANNIANIWDASLGRVANSFRILLGYRIAAFFINLPSQLIELGKEAVQTAVKMESLNASFAGIAKGAAAGANALEFVRNIAQRVGTDFLSTADSFKNLMAAAQGTVLEGDRIRKIFEQMSIAGRVLGLDAGQMQRALLALEQMISKGTISSEELRKQLGNAIPGALNIMARALGVTTAELNAMMKAGELITVEVLPKFLDQIERDFGPGLEKAANTASATFARFGNNVRDVSVAIGDAILTILKPAMDAINKGFELWEKARKAAEDAKNQGVGETPERLAPLPGAPDLNKRLENMRRLLDENQEVLRGLNLAISEGLVAGTAEDLKAVAEQEDIVKRYTAAWKRMLQERQNFLESQGESGAIGGIGETPFARQTKEVTEELKKLDDQRNRMAMQQKYFSSLLTGDEAGLTSAREKLSELRKAIENIAESLGKAKGLRDVGLTAQLEKQAADLNAQYAAAKANVDQLEAARDAEKQADQEAKKRRADLIEQARADAREREAIEQKMRESLAEMVTDHAAKETEQLNKLLEDARRVGADRTLTEQYESTRRVQINQDEFQAIAKDYAKGLPDIRRVARERMDVEAMITSFALKATKTRLDDHDEEVAQKRANLQEMINQEKATQDDMEALIANAAARRSAIESEEQNTLLKEQTKGWRDLVDAIEQSIASNLYNVLTGTKNLFEGIRDAFLKLLAQMAADALTRAIVIPVIAQIVGSGFLGGGGGGTAGSALGAFGLSGTGGATGAGGGDNSLAQAIGLVTAGNSISGAIGGPSIGLGTGGFGASIAATEIGRLPLVGGWFGGPGAGAAGPTTAAGAATVGQVLGGIGAGIAVGQILSMINGLIGFGGTGSAVAAGAGGGATAGALIGSVFPVVGTGIGAAVGTAVGALGGYLSTLFGGGGKKPGFEIEEMQAGRIRYDDSIGMVVERNFQILDDFHQKLGTDYEEFIKVVNDSINDVFQQVVSQISGAHPEIQRALVDPLNSAFQDIAVLIRDYPRIGGDDMKKQLEVMLGTDIPKIFADAANGAIEQFTEAVAKIDPVVKAFVTIIEALHEDIRELQRQQKALDDTLKGNIQTLGESLMSPAQVLLERKKQLDTLMGEFQSGDEATRIGLAPKIGDLTTAILELSKTVLSAQTSYGDLTGIQGAIKQLGETLYTPAQTLAARQADLTTLMEQFRAGTSAMRAGLAPEITQLALNIMELSKSVNVLAEQQALLADFPAQLRAVSEALYSPAQTFLSQQVQLQDLVARFRAGTPEQQLAFEPQIAALAAQLINLAKGQDVLGQDPTLLRQTQADLLAIMQEVQGTIAAQVNSSTSDAAALQATLLNTQNQLMGVLREVQIGVAGTIVEAGQGTIQALFASAGQIISTDYALANGVITAQYYTSNGVITAQYNAAGQLVSAEHYIGGVLWGAINNTSATVAGWSNALYQIQAQLIGQVASVRDTAWYSYTQLQNVLWAEVGLAQEQIRLLIGSLSHLETVDAVVQNALGVLGQMNARLGNPLRVDMQGSLGEQLQRDSLQTANNLLRSQQNANRAIIALLAKPAYGLSFQQGLDLGSGYIGYQHGGYIPRDMTAMLHRGERVVPEWDNRGTGGAKTIAISVYGGSKDPTQIAEAVVRIIETKAGRLHESKLQVARR